MDVFSRKSNANCIVSLINQHRMPIKKSNGTTLSAKFNRLNWIIDIISVFVRIAPLFEVEHLAVSLQKEISETLDEYWSIYKQRSDSFPKLPKPSKSHVAR